MCEIKQFIVYQCNRAGTFTGLFVEAVGCEIVHFENLTDGGFMENVLLSGRIEYVAFFGKFFLRASQVGAFKKSWKYVIFTKIGQHVNEMRAVAVINFQNF